MRGGEAVVTVAKGWRRKNGGKKKERKTEKERKGKKTKKDGEIGWQHARNQVGARRQR